ncbi:hypothetical protein DFH06DRAFT_1127576 [Mycena polygramma]|nr:hypothetical protein DFH06DRAFT_1127576 [Mycena polygramma]
MATASSFSREPSSQVVSELHHWQTKRFRDYELPWAKAAESLNSGKPLIEIRSNKDGSRWTVYNKATDKIAIFAHAGVWCWASPPQTGNFVPEGETAPEGVHPSRIMAVLSKKVETSYTFNTEDDPSFYNSAQILEEHAKGLKGFNKYNKTRRSWQEGITDYSRRRFIFSSRLVIRRTPHNSKAGSEASLPPDLHPWLQDALRAQRYQIWIPNPEMPAILNFDDGKLEALKPTDSRYFENGDLVWFSFALSFDVNSNNWMPEYKPLDFIRVGNLPISSESRYDYFVDEAVGSAYKSLSAGKTVLLDDDELVDKDLKRARDSDGDDTMSDGGLSDISAYSAAQAALRSSAKRVKVDDALATSLLAKGNEDGLKKKVIKGRSK